MYKGARCDAGRLFIHTTVSEPENPRRIAVFISHYLSYVSLRGCKIVRRRSFSQEMKSNLIFLDRIKAQ